MFYVSIKKKTLMNFHGHYAYMVDFRKSSNLYIVNHSHQTINCIVKNKPLSYLWLHKSCSTQSSGIAREEGDNFLDTQETSCLKKKI